MRTVPLIAALALGACTTSSSMPPANVVTCASPSITQVDATNGTCKIDFRMCDDGILYDLRCRNLNLDGVDDEGIDCLCDIDGVTPGGLAGGDIGVSDTTCADAGSIASSRWQRVWLECNVDMTISP